MEQIAGDIKESVARVSEVAFDASENANIPSVSYEVTTGGHFRHTATWAGTLVALSSANCSDRIAENWLTQPAPAAWEAEHLKQVFACGIAESSHSIALRDIPYRLP